MTQRNTFAFSHLIIWSCNLKSIVFASRSNTTYKGTASRALCCFFSIEGAPNRVAGRNPSLGGHQTLLREARTNCSCTKHSCAKLAQIVPAPNTLARSSHKLFLHQTLLREARTNCSCTKHSCAKLAQIVPAPNTLARSAHKLCALPAVV